MTTYDIGLLAPPYRPQETDKVLRAFPATIAHLLPPYADIPEHYRDPGFKDDWTDLFSDWMFFPDRLTGVSFAGVEDIDKDPGATERAYWHLSCIIGSYSISHEYKSAAMAFLMSQWFVGVRTDARLYGEEFEAA